MLVLTGCATSKSIYYWGDYSESAYELKHEPSEKSLSEHKNVLMDIVENAERKHKKIPPGIFAELAKIELDANNIEGAKQLLEQEKAHFPESARMVEVLYQLMDKKESNHETTS